MIDIFSDSVTGRCNRHTTNPGHGFGVDSTGIVTSLSCTKAVPFLLLLYATCTQAMYFVDDSDSSILYTELSPPSANTGWFLYRWNGPEIYNRTM